MLHAIRRELERNPWGWLAVGVFCASFGIGNLYYLAPAGDRMAAVKIFAASVVLLPIMYCGLLARRPGERKASILVIVCIAVFTLSLIDTLSISETFVVPIMLDIWALKAVTTISALLIMMSFATGETFEKCVWACLVGFEGYSFFQFRVCKISPSGDLDPSLYYTWGIQVYKASCAREGGILLAYAEVFIVAAFILGICWRHLSARRS